MQFFARHSLLGRTRDPPSWRKCVLVPLRKLAGDRASLGARLRQVAPARHAVGHLSLLGGGRLARKDALETVGDFACVALGGGPSKPSRKPNPNKHLFGLGFRLGLLGPPPQAKQASSPAVSTASFLASRPRNHPEDCDPCLPRPSTWSLKTVINMLGKHNDEYFEIADTIEDPQSREEHMRRVREIEDVFNFLVRTHRVQWSEERIRFLESRPAPVQAGPRPRMVWGWSAA